MTDITDADTGPTSSSWVAQIAARADHATVLLRDTWHMYELCDEEACGCKASSAYAACIASAADTATLLAHARVLAEENETLWLRVANAETAEVYEREIAAPKRETGLRAKQDAAEAHARALEAESDKWVAEIERIVPLWDADRAGLKRVIGELVEAKTRAEQAEAERDYYRQMIDADKLAILDERDRLDLAHTKLRTKHLELEQQVAAVLYHMPGVLLTDHWQGVFNMSAELAEALHTLAAAPEPDPTGEQVGRSEPRP